MAAPRACLLQLSRQCARAPLRPAVLPTISSFCRPQIRCAATGTSENAAKYKRKHGEQTPNKKKKKARNTFIQHDTKDAMQFSLVDAMQYIRAYEVYRDPTSSKYELHVKVRTLKNGPTLRNRLRLPHPVKGGLRICVIAPPNSRIAQQAKEAGASLVGDEEIFDAVKKGKIEFDRCVCHVDSLPALNKAGVARILGPRGLMPNAKMGTVSKDVATVVKNMIGGSEYRERQGVVRMAIGQLAFTPEMMQKNIKTFMDQLKKDIGMLNDRISKEIHEVVLSSTNSPGFSLNGEFRSANSVPPEALSINDVETEEVPEAAAQAA